MSGETLLITRPKGDGEALTEALHERGFRSVHEPLTEMFLKHTVRPELEAALVCDPDAVLVTSRHGVQSLSALTDLRDLSLVCVGEETALSAQSAGFSRVACAGPDVQRLIDFVISAYDPGSRFLYISAEQVRTDLAVALGQGGMQAERLAVYEAAASEQLSEVTVEQIRRGQIDAVTFFSARAARIFLALLEKADLGEATASMHAFALSDAIAQALQEQPWRGLHVADEPTLASLVTCVDNAFS